MDRRSAWIEPVSERAMVPVAECSWPTVTSVSVTARPVVLTSARAIWLNTLAASSESAAAPNASRRGRKRVGESMVMLLWVVFLPGSPCGYQFGSPPACVCHQRWRYTQHDVTAYVI